MHENDENDTGRWGRARVRVARGAGFPRILAALLATCLGGGCAITVPAQEPLLPEPVYDSLYPYYVEVAAVSQIRARFAAEGGSPGHAVMYLKGARLDRSAGYPRLALVDPETADLSDPETGVGVSVNKTFKNVNWMAVEGKRLFFDGNLDEGEVVDQAALRAVIVDAVTAGVWDGIEIHERYQPPEGDDRAMIELVASESVGTDFAVRFGRALFATRMPMTRERLRAVIDYLNGLNDEYASGKADYNWSGYHDNCVHTLHNALAAAGVWKPQAVRTTKLRQFFNLAIPANQMIALAIRGNDFPIEDFDRLYDDEVLRASLLEHGWLPAEPGVLVEYEGPHAQNELFDTRQTILVAEAPFVRRKSRRVAAMARDPRFTRVLANLRYFEKRYQRILDAREEGWDRPDPQDAKALARQRYYEYVQAELAEVRTKLEFLGAPPLPAAPAARAPQPLPGFPGIPAAAVNPAVSVSSEAMPRARPLALPIEPGGESLPMASGKGRPGRLCVAAS